MREPSWKTWGGYEDGTLHDELKWTEVSTHACRLLNSLEKVVFFTPSELIRATHFVDRARGDGYRMVTIPETIKEKIHGLHDLSGNPMMDLSGFQMQWNKSFKFDFIGVKDMTPQERRIFGMTKAILRLAGGKPKHVKKIRISETMRIDPVSLRESEGVWEESTGSIIIKRAQLKGLEKYAGTLLHELCHAKSGASDISDEFEKELTCLVGAITAKSLENEVE